MEQVGRSVNGKLATGIKNRNCSNIFQKDLHAEHEVHTSFVATCLTMVVYYGVNQSVGGVTNRYLPTVEIYNSKTGKWIETGEMTTPRYGHAALLLPNGNVFVVGGESGKGTLSSAELYNSETGTWTVTTSMHNTHYGCKAKLNPDGTVLVFVTPFNRPNIILEHYDPANQKWTVITGQ
jgi:hypothetical protein